MKKFLTIFISLSLILSLSVCWKKSTTKITNFDAQDISDKSFYCDVTSDDLSVSTDCTDNLEASNTNIVVDKSEKTDTSRTVYITLYGSKYHYRQSCAGGNAITTTEKSAIEIYEPCKKCAQ